MRSSRTLSGLFFVFALLFASASFAQQDKSKRPSPPDSVTGKVRGATITINYSSPSVKGRKIFGGLEAYGKVWRAGANEATTFETNKEIKVEGQSLPAGKYGLFMIPGEKEWTVIFNKVPNQWGAFTYDATKDQLRVTVKPRTVSMHERLVYVINKDGFSLIWDTVEVPVRIE